MRVALTAAAVRSLTPPLLVATALSLSLLTTSVPTRAEPRAIDGVVAVVEGRFITVGLLRIRAAPALKRLRMWNGPAWKKNEMAREIMANALESKIEEVLLAQVARQARLDVPWPDDTALDRMASDEKITRAELLAKWGVQGYSRQDILDEVARSWLRQTVLRDAAQKERGVPGEPPAEWQTRWLEALKQKATIERRIPR